MTLQTAIAQAPEDIRATATAMLAGYPVAFEAEYRVSEYMRSQGVLSEWYDALRGVWTGMGYGQTYDAQAQAVALYAGKPGEWVSEGELRERATLWGSIVERVREVGRDIMPSGGVLPWMVLGGAVIVAAMIWRMK